MKYSAFYTPPQSFQNAKSIFSSQGMQNQEVGWVWPEGHHLPTSAMGPGHVQEGPEAP